MPLNVQVRFLNSIQQISMAQWQRLNSSSCPFLRYEFFKALEESESTCAASGWQPHHLTLNNDHGLNSIMPMYLKNHSWGEYVFDWDWANAFEQHGVDYYPKLVSTLPFTPVTSDKLLSKTHQQQSLFHLLTDHCQQQNINSWHLLYCPKIPEEQLAEELDEALADNVYERNTVQFHWFNRDYKNFDDYLNTFTARKRKNTRKERLSIVEQGLSVRQVIGRNITAIELNFFYLTYQLTYLRRGHKPHLNFSFFEQVFKSMADNILLVIASHQAQDVACALFFFDDENLYGRYWGSSQFFNHLHFELCYYQGIEFCIENNLKIFNPGTQGEHKIQRGFEPVLTHSYHWIKHAPFKSAVKDFCLQEQQQMKIYQQQCLQALPFKHINNKKE